MGWCPWSASRRDWCVAISLTAIFPGFESSASSFVSYLLCIASFLSFSASFTLLCKLRLQHEKYQFYTQYSDRSVSPFRLLLHCFGSLSEKYVSAFAGVLRELLVGGSRKIIVNGNLDETRARADLFRSMYAIDCALHTRVSARSRKNARSWTDPLRAFKVPATRVAFPPPFLPLEGPPKLLLVTLPGKSPSTSLMSVPRSASDSFASKTACRSSTCSSFVG